MKFTMITILILLYNIVITKRIKLNKFSTNNLFRAPYSDWSNDQLLNHYYVLVYQMSKLSRKLFYLNMKLNKQKGEDSQFYNEITIERYKTNKEIEIVNQEIKLRIEKDNNVYKLDNCPICLMPALEEIYITKCWHIYHYRCFGDLISHSLLENEIKCSICKDTFYKDLNIIL